ncbi:hypothetical protein [Ornithinimicrobium sp. INDO-MA30-4]|uniref:hypothetical protein n=1 Tax=Ornithinimicrobium sp. INDO-MA30-4 TaxID=2908651 RepID=UPI001F16C9CE|nr:hypothetical protein [Ornithinimicrobium sp. INDO-MA30-4]UJH71703.1 hypothetical protein L0A91_10845 [Ornithinimicrobium sp. INDO-MA30-4]
MAALGQDPRALWSLILGLGLLGTGVAYIFYYYIVDKLGAITASSATYIPQWWHWPLVRCWSVSRLGCWT